MRRRPSDALDHTIKRLENLQATGLYKGLLRPHAGKLYPVCQCRLTLGEQREHGGLVQAILLINRAMNMCSDSENRKEHEAYMRLWSVRFKCADRLRYLNRKGICEA